MDESPRYRGKPMLILLENYALDVIGKLPPDKHNGLAAITMKVWGGGHDWRATIRAQMEWDGRMDAEILENWRDFQVAAAKQGQPVNELVFAQAFADEIEKRGR
jgi:hypothetical protein